MDPQARDRLWDHRSGVLPGSRPTASCRLRNAWASRSGTGRPALSSSNPRSTMGAPSASASHSAGTAGGSRWESWDNTVRLWEPATDKEPRTLYGHKGYALSVAFSPDGSLLASTGEDRSVRLWEVATGRELANFSWPHHACLRRSVPPRRPADSLWWHWWRGQGLGRPAKPPGHVSRAFLAGDRDCVQPRRSPRRHGVGHLAPAHPRGKRHRRRRGRRSRSTEVLGPGHGRGGADARGARCRHGVCAPSVGSGTSPSQAPTAGGFSK